ncbi:MAG: alpha/beta fold hydrolase [Sphingobacteriaceae bacterium]|nr:alpha/beta fold hydrolase [Cytophagaceae bacterium]
MKLLRILARTLLVLFVLLNGVLAFHAYRFTYFYETAEVPYRKPEDIPTSERIQQVLFGFRFGKRPNLEFPEKPFQTVWLTNPDGQRLEAWATQTPNPKGTLVLFHGHASCKSKVLAEQAYFRSLGFNTLAVDFRAHGGSEGNVTTIGYREAGDVKAAYDYARAQGGPVQGGPNVVLWGVSMGAASILSALHEYPELHPSRVMLECPFGSMQAAVEGRLRTMGLPTAVLSPVLIFWGSVERGMWGFGYQPSDYAKTVHCPVLLNRGMQDKRVLRPETEAIFANLGTKNKKLVVFENSGHQSFCQNEAQKWKAEVAAFLNVPEPTLALGKQ